MLVNIISIILSTLLSGISIFIAIRAYKQGTKQIEISNKQSLFKERTNVFLQLNSLYEIYGQNKHLLDGSDSIPEFPFHMGNELFLIDGVILYLSYIHIMLIHNLFHQVVDKFLD